MMFQFWIFAAAFASPPLTAVPVTQPSASNDTDSTSDEGFVTAKLDVNESGTVDKCTVVATNAPQDFSEKVCGILASKAKFDPKLDDKGIAQKTSLTQTIRFKLQD